MGSYRIEESPNKRAGCKTTICKKHEIKIQKGELRLGTWVDTERYQSWSYRHWGCVTPKVLANILEAIAEGGEPDFDMLDGFEELSAENQAKIKEAILKGELDEADKTDYSLLIGEAYEDAQNEANDSPEKAKTGTKAKSKKRSRAESDAEEEAPSKTKKAKGTAKEETTEEKPAKRSRARKVVKEESPEEEEVLVKPAKKAKGRTAAKEGALDEKPAKRSRARKADEEEPAEPEKPARKSKKVAAAVKDKSDEAEADVEEEEAEVQQPAKKARGKTAAATSEKPKRGRKKKVAEDEE
ncbi:hypothetical protein ZTR_00091 [Talaromyces verruculosus]|nr:hypothetical protein ZTR_00091 [Talaromyces verruculosus]